MNGQRPIRPNYTNNLISYGPNIPINQTPYIFDNPFVDYEDNYTYVDEMNEYLSDEMRPIYVLQPNQQQIQQPNQQQIQQTPDVQELTQQEYEEECRLNEQINNQNNQIIPNPLIMQQVQQVQQVQQIPDVQEISKEEFEGRGRYFDWLKAYKDYKQNMNEYERQVLHTPNGFTSSLPSSPPPSSPTPISSPTPPPQFIQVPTINSTPSPVTRRPVYITLTPQ